MDLSQDYFNALVSILNGEPVVDLHRRQTASGLTWSYSNRGSDECALIEAAEAVNKELLGSNPHTVFRTNRIYRTVDEVREECVRTNREGVLKFSNGPVN